MRSEASIVLPVLEWLSVPSFFPSRSFAPIAHPHPGQGFGSPYRPGDNGTWMEPRVAYSVEFHEACILYSGECSGLYGTK